MLPGVSAYNSGIALLLAAPAWPLLCAALPSTGHSSRRSLILDYSPAPPPEDGPPLSAGALRDPAYLPAQVGGIVGAYALSLVLVALLLLALSKTRRQHLRNRDLPDENRGLASFNPFPAPFQLQSEEEYKRQLEQFQKLTIQTDLPRSPTRNFSLPSASPLSPSRTGPLSPTKSQRSAFTAPSPTSTILAAGIDLSVDQTVVQRDRAMAQQQLEEMYKYVMEHEQAKAEGREYEGPPLLSPSSKSASSNPAGRGRKEKNKPSNLNLARDEKTQSRSSSIFSFLKSPRKSKMSGSMSITSPIMTPMSGTFPRHDDQEMNAMPPRHYAPPVPPPVQSELPLRQAASAAPSGAASNNLPTPDVSPISTQSIDSRIDAAIGQPPSRDSRAAARREKEKEKEKEQEQEQERGREREREREARGDGTTSHSRDESAATSTTGEREPVSAVSERSTTGLVGLPSSPKPGANRFPSLDSLPASPRPSQQSFPPPGGAGTNKPSAVREGGMLPLRAYEPSLSSPTASSYATKQTVFTRTGPLSPGPQTGLRTPWTGAPVPYTPYQPFSPVVPITPTVVTRADRKRMKKLEPKTPTVEMVKSTDEVW